MQTCFYCGEGIETRGEDQHTVPFHSQGSCSYRRARELKTLRSFYHRSRCPKCARDVFYLRHDGGSVWLNQMGYPWPKHPCMDLRPKSARRKSAFRMAEDLDPSYLLGCVLDAKEGRGKTELLVKTETLRVAHVSVIKGGDLSALKDEVIFFSERTKDCRYHATFRDLTGKPAIAIAKRKIEPVVWLPL